MSRAITIVLLFMVAVTFPLPVLGDSEIQVDGNLSINNGIIYLDKGTGGGSDSYIVFPDGTHQATATLAGPQGLKGDTGATGATGPKGDMGATGSQGIPGSMGPTGSTGPQGSEGPAGGVIKYSKIAVVAQSGGDYTNPVSAMTAVASWCGTPSVTNPCLLKIMPGQYYVGTNGLQMQSYVDIEGSGANVTFIDNAMTPPPSANNAELRFINVGGTQISINPASMQSRVTGSCTSGSSIRQINQNGTVTCQTDANSGGTVTSVNTGSGLTGGPITGSGTIAIATGAITATQLADTAVATAKLADAAVTSAKLADTSVSTAKLADGSVTTAKLNVNANVNMHDKDLSLRGDAFHGLGWYGAGKLFAGVDVNGPALYGGSGGVLGTNNGGQKIALAWDQNGNLTASNSLTITDTLWLYSTSHIYMQGGELYLRNDTNHGLGWYGIGKQFAGNSLDGPAVYGYSGGALGTTSGGQKVALAWNSSGGVTMTGNIMLPATTATTGVIKSGADTLIHTYGTDNFFAGVNAGNLTMTGSFNTANGYYALSTNTAGTDNTASGGLALLRNTTGSYNTASGRNALYSNTTGHDNTASGSWALHSNANGDDNTANGGYSLKSNTTGSYNTANGYYALYSNTTGYDNTAIGDHALALTQIIHK